MGLALRPFFFVILWALRGCLKSSAMVFADEKLAVSSDTFRSLSLQLQMGMESGEVVESIGILMAMSSILQRVWRIWLGRAKSSQASV
jgi:hypothetical protein